MGAGSREFESRCPDHFHCQHFAPPRVAFFATKHGARTVALSNLPPPNEVPRLIAGPKEASPITAKQYASPKQAVTEKPNSGFDRPDDEIPF